MIEVKNLVVQTKGFTLNDVSLTVQTGLCHALLGPTGCGKTTLLESVLGLREIKSGTILLDSKDITHLPVHQRGFSYVPQDLAIFPHLTVQENIFYGIRHGLINDKDARYKAGLQIAEQLGISHLLGRKAFNLSGGERQRVALARALAPGHRYLLLDEPLSALHEGMKKEMWFLLKDLQQRYNLTILMVSHDIEETFFLADNITIMINGVIHQSATKDEIYHRPCTRETADFFGIKNIFMAELFEDHKVFCPELNAYIEVRPEMLKDLGIKEHLYIGIRAEEVMILRHDLCRFKDDNTLEGTVLAVFKKGAINTVIFKPDRAVKNIEIELPNYAYSKLAITEMQRIKIALRKGNIFCLKA